MQAILFDLDGTLFDRESAVRDLLAQQYRSFAVELADVSEAAYVARVLELDAHGHGDKAAAYRQVGQDFALSERLAASLAADFWATYHSFCRGFPEVSLALLELRKRGFRLGVVTNGLVQVQEPVIRRLDLPPLRASWRLAAHGALASAEDPARRDRLARGSSGARRARKRGGVAPASRAPSRYLPGQMFRPSNSRNGILLS
jgi:phosphoglycolate phosphatase-like HAD superfamily hydrolase